MRVLPQCNHHGRAPGRESPRPADPRRPGNGPAPGSVRELSGRRPGPRATPLVQNMTPARRAGQATGRATRRPSPCEVSVPALFHVEVPDRKWHTATFSPSHREVGQVLLPGPDSAAVGTSSIRRSQEYRFVATADEYFEENHGVSTEEYFELEESGDLVSILDVRARSTQHGTLEIKSDCTWATVDYCRSGSSSISVSFRVRYNASGTVATSWSPADTMTSRGGTPSAISFASLGQHGKH